MWVPFSLPLYDIRTPAGQVGGRASTDLEWCLPGITISSREKQDRCMPGSAVLAPCSCVMPWRSTGPPSSSDPAVAECPCLALCPGGPLFGDSRTSKLNWAPVLLHTMVLGHNAQNWPASLLPFSPRSYWLWVSHPHPQSTDSKSKVLFTLLFLDKKA